MWDAHLCCTNFFFFHNFLGEYAPQWHLTHVMMLANKLGYLQMYNCVEGHARKKYMSTYREIEIKIVALEFNLSKL